jgi:Domain of unknown function (DUF4347)
MPVSKAKRNCDLQIQAIPIGNRMLALDPRRAFDLAIASEMHDLFDTHPDVPPQPIAPEGIGGKIASAVRGLFATDNARNVEAQLAADHQEILTVSSFDRAVMTHINAHNLAPSKHQIAFISSYLADLDSLVCAVPDGTRIVLIDGGRDGVAQMLDALQNELGLTGLHIISYGAAGQIKLGTSTLDAQTMCTTYATALASIGTHLHSDAHILVYGCNFAAGDIGTRAVHLLAELTGANVVVPKD